MTGRSWAQGSTKPRLARRRALPAAAAAAPRAGAHNGPQRGCARGGGSEPGRYRCCGTAAPQPVLFSSRVSRDPRHRRG